MRPETRDTIETLLDLLLLLACEIVKLIIVICILKVIFVFVFGA